MYISAPKSKLSRKKYLLDAEQEQLNALLEKYKDQDARNCTLIWVALHTGARASEILNITKDDFCLEEAVVCIRGLKGSDDREIPLPKWLADRVSKLVPGADGRIFPLSYNRFREIWVLYRPVEKKLHSLRHTFAINLYRKSKDVRLVQCFLGHRNIQHTMIYASYDYSLSEMRRVLFGSPAQ
jgi:integrase/recombinase XerC